MSKNKPVNDPLEAAKVGKDAPKKSGWGKNKGKDKSSPKMAPPPEVRQAAPAPLPPAPTPPPAPAPAPVKEAAAPTPPAEPEPAPVKEAVAPPSPVAPAPAAEEVVAAPVGVLKFRVRKTRSFSRNGQMTVLKEGSVISSQHYGGMPGIEKLRSSGLELDLVEG